ncbi:hypothetical protein WNY61_19215 [Sulfitobacter sp. AS92]
MSFQDMSYISILLMRAVSSLIMITWFVTEAILTARPSARMFQKEAVAMELANDIEDDLPPKH